MVLDTPAGEMDVTVHVPGLYNVYNGLAAVAATLAFGIAPQHIKAGLEAFTAAFGRIERMPVPGTGDKRLLMALVKNPVGFNEVLRMLFPVVGARGRCRGRRHLLIIINDLIADGRDVSWLWDVDFEVLANSRQGVARVDVAGLRAGDMAVRLKYAGVDAEVISGQVACRGAGGGGGGFA